jgi:ATP-dependent protease ClpP protease subunit
MSETEKKAIWVHETATYEYNIYVGDLTEGINEHIESIDLIRTASEDDKINLLITSVGGDVDIAENYLAAIRDSKAQITTRAIGCVASAGATIWLAGGNRACDERAYFMFHNVQYGGMNGDGHLVKTRMDFYDKHYRSLFEELFKDVMTEEELHSVFSGGEVYITGADMLKRLEVKGDGKWSRHMEVGKTEASPIVDEGGVVGVTITLSDGFSKHLDLATLNFKDFDEFSWAEIREIAASVGLSLPSPVISRRIDTLHLIEFFKTSGGKA